VKLAAWIATVELVGFVAAASGGLVGENPWFDDLPKPAFWPPTFVFPLAWSLVNYPSLSIATWRLWSVRRNTTIAPQLAVFGVVMLVNVTFGFVVIERREPTFTCSWTCSALGHPSHYS